VAKSNGNLLLLALVCLCFQEFADESACGEMWVAYFLRDTASSFAGRDVPRREKMLFSASDFEYQSRNAVSEKYDISLFCV
jgi:hypothetical protein